MENNESKIRKVLRSEIAWLLGFVILVASIAISFAGLKNDIQNIKENHLHTLSENLDKYYKDDISRSQKNADDIKEICGKLEQTNLRLERVSTILEKIYK
jgi:hypothetical protein